MRLRYRSAVRSHPGLVRSVNEDMALGRDNVALWLVADGMGGHSHGDWASKTLAAHLADVDLAVPLAERGPAIVAAMHAGNAEIVAAANRAGSQMGTTAVLLHLEGNDALCMWVGDSRAYIQRRGGLFQLTVDHTHVQDLIDEGILTPADAVGHPMSHVLTRALGVAEDLQVDIIKDEVEPGDRFVLCSDGLSGPVSDADIRALLEHDNPQTAVDALIERAYANGAPDNVTAIVIEIGAF